MAQNTKSGSPHILPLDDVQSHGVISDCEVPLYYLALIHIHRLVNSEIPSITGKLRVTLNWWMMYRQTDRQRRCNCIIQSAPSPNIRPLVLCGQNILIALVTIVVGDGEWRVFSEPLRMSLRSKLWSTSFAGGVKGNKLAHSASQPVVIHVTRIRVDWWWWGASYSRSYAFYKRY